MAIAASPLLSSGRLLVVSAAFVGLAAAQPREYEHFRVERVADGVFAALATDGYATSNAGIVDLGDSTLVFDTFMTPEAARELRRAAVALTGHEVRAAVDSHVHDDHVGGNEVFADVPVFATAFTRAQLPSEERASIEDAKKNGAQLARDADAALARETGATRRAELAFWRSYVDAQRLALPTIHITPPDRTVDREETFRGSRRSVQLVAVGAAHTKSDLIAYVPDARVVFAGDVLFVRAHPYLPDGSLDGWIDALQRIKRLSPRSIIPGHGTVGSIADVDAMADYLGALKQIATTPELTGTAVPPVPRRFADWVFERFYPANVRFARKAVASEPRSTVTSGAPESADRRDLDKAIAAELRKRAGVGASVAVVENGRVVLARAYGRASLDSPVPAGDDTVFAVGSVTKQFTAATVLLLAEEGKLAVTDRVAKYYPNLTRASEISLLDLMNHVSGYPDYYPLDFVDRRMMQPIAADALLARYAGSPLDFEPGTRWSYSNTGFLLLGRIVEKVTSQPFGSVLADRIFRRFGMQHTVFEPDQHEPRLARGYTSFALAPLAPAVPEARGWIGAAGGIWSTAGDLATWDLALMERRVLKPESWALMTKPRVLANGASTGYGCGIGSSVQNGTIVLSHGGAVSGFIANNTLVPATKSAVVVLINDEDAGLQSAIIRDASAGIVPSAPPPGSAQANASSVTEARPVPHVNGPAAKDAAIAMFAALQTGKVDRVRLGEEFNVFLTDAKIAAASKALGPFGKPTRVDVRSVAERGGMEVTSIRFTFSSGALNALMYRSPDAKIEEFLVSRP